jgi:thiol-disulfide isomerase/thioredoxin
MGLKKVRVSGSKSLKFRCMSDIFRMMDSVDNETICKTLGQSKGLYKYFDSLEKKSLQILESYKNSLLPVEYDLLKANLVGANFYVAYEYLVLDHTISNEIKAKYQAKVSNSNLPVKPNSTYLQFVAPVFYTRYIEGRAVFKRYNKKGIVARTSALNTKEYWDIINSSIQGYMRNRVLASYFLFKLNTSAVNDTLFAFAKQFAERNNNSFRDTIRSLIAFRIQELSKGKNAFDFELSDTSGRIIRMKDFCGKVLLIDFMFTGCPGCAQMLPYLKKVEEKYEDNDHIEFLSISTTKNIADVKKGAGLFSAKGSVQLYTNGLETNHPIIQFYKISAYPTLLIVDKKGKIFSIPAPDPRNDDGKSLKELLDTALAAN